MDAITASRCREAKSAMEKLLSSTVDVGANAKGEVIIKMDGNDVPLLVNLAAQVNERIEWT